MWAMNILQLFSLWYAFIKSTPCFSSRFRSQGYFEIGISSLATKYKTLNLVFVLARSFDCILVMPAVISCCVESLAAFMVSALSCCPFISFKCRFSALLCGSPRAWSSALLKQRLVDAVNAQVVERFFIPFIFPVWALHTEQFKRVTRSDLLFQCWQQATRLPGVWPRLLFSNH